MDISQRLIITCTAQRVTYLDKLHRYEDRYAISCKFCEWTKSFNVYPEELKAAIVKVLTLNKENRTG